MVLNHLACKAALATQTQSAHAVWWLDSAGDWLIPLSIMHRIALHTGNVITWNSPGRILLYALGKPASPGGRVQLVNRSNKCKFNSALLSPQNMWWKSHWLIVIKITLTPTCHGQNHPNTNLWSKSPQHWLVIKITPTLTCDQNHTNTDLSWSKSH